MSETPFKPYLTVSENPSDYSYDVTYHHKQYGASIKVSREMLEDKMATTGMATTGWNDHLADSLSYYGQQQLREAQMAQQQLASGHTHVFGNALGGLGAAGTTWTTTTNATDTAYINGATFDQAWIDEAVERKITEMGKQQAPKRETKGHWPNRWYRVNEDMSPKDYGLRHYEPEPLDDLRKEIGEWLYENQN